VSTTSVTSKDKFGGWKDALSEAQRQLNAMEVRIISLRKSIKIIEKKIKEGEEWPASDGTVTNFIPRHLS